MASIRKFRDKWRAEVRRQGHKPMSKMFLTKGAASSWARETEIALEKGDIHNITNKTMADLIERYLDEYPDTGTYETNQLNKWKGHVGKIKLSEVRKAHIVDARRKVRRQRSTKGINKGMGRGLGRSVLRTEPYAWTILTPCTTFVRTMCAMRM